MTTGRLPSVEGGIQPTIVDAKGDLIVATAADTVSRIAVGSNDQVLTADSSTSTGVKWATPASGGGMTLISETVASGLSSLSFSSLGSYKQLLLMWQGISFSGNGRFEIRLNNDSTANIYTMQGITASPSVASDLRNNDIIFPGVSSIGQSVTNTASENLARGWLIVDNYTSTTRFKQFYGGLMFRDAQFSESKGSNYVGTYKSTSAVTSIDIVRYSGTQTFSNETSYNIRLYGVS